MAAWLWRLPLLFVLVTGSQVLALRVVDPPFSSFMAIRQMQALAHGDWSFRIAHDWRDLQGISPNLPLALVAAEDQNFMRHHGFDFSAIDKARARIACAATHTVVAIEDVIVPAGSFEAARIASTWECSAPGEPPIQASASAWIASEVGMVEAHFTSAQTGLWEYELGCLELPESAGSCGAR